MTLPPDADLAPGRSLRHRPRLLAVIIGIDAYDHADVQNLHGAARDACLVHDALNRTHATRTDVTSRLLVSGGEAAPTRQGLGDALRDVAADAGPADTVLIHFSGHGVLTGGRVALVPNDGHPDRLESLLAVQDIQDLFKGSRCPRRALFLDACQEAVAGDVSAVPDAVEGPVMATRGAGGYRARGRASSAFVQALDPNRRGWIVLTSCGPGELSLESDELDGHGIFSYYLALGLRGEADLDRDGTVGLGELAQYIANQVPREARLASGGFLSQTPELLCRGQITPFTDQGAAQGDAAPAYRRSLRLPRGFARDWWQAMRGHWPFEPVTAWRWLVRGGALLYALAMGLSVLSFLGTDTVAGWASAAAVAALCLVLWPALVAFAQASTVGRFHHGGYVDGAIMLLWHGLVFAGVGLLGSVWGVGEAEGPRPLILFGVSLFIQIVVMVVFGFNVLHMLLAILDLERRREEGALRDFFRQFDRQLFRAEFPCTIACETIHPRIYAVLWVILTLGLVGHATYLLVATDVAASEGLALLWDAVLWVLLAWQVSGISAIYMQLRRKHPMQVKA